MAGRFGRSFYRFSSVNRPLAPGGNTSGQDSAQQDGRRYTSVTRDTSLEPRARSPPLSPRRESLPASPTYFAKKAASPPLSPQLRAPTARRISSPPKPIDEYPKYKPTTQPRSPEPEHKSMVYKAIEKVTKSDRHPESGKTASSHRQQPNAINIKGENLGAVMEIIESSKREGGHIIRKKETSKGVDQYNEASKDHKAGGQKAPNSFPASTFLNSNFQSVNNSLLFNASLAHHDPGLHLAFSRNPTGNRLTVDDKNQPHKKH